MSALNLPEDDLLFVREQVAAGASPTPEAYVSQLIRAEQRRRAKAALEAAILEGIDSGPAEEWTPEDWEEMRREIREQGSGSANS